jgi:hypothetical protein
VGYPPQRLKLGYFCPANGTTEVVPFPSVALVECWAAMRVKVRIKVKGDGQERPSHTSNPHLNNPTRLPAAGLQHMGFVQT